MCIKNIDRREVAELLTVVEIRSCNIRKWKHKEMTHWLAGRTYILACTRRYILSAYVTRVHSTKLITTFSNCQFTSLLWKSFTKWYCFDCRCLSQTAENPNGKLETPKHLVASKTVRLSSDSNVVEGLPSSYSRHRKQKTWKSGADLWFCTVIKTRADTSAGSAVSKSFFSAFIIVMTFTADSSFTWYMEQTTESLALLSVRSQSSERTEQLQLYTQEGRAQK